MLKEKQLSAAQSFIAPVPLTTTQKADIVSTHSWWLTSVMAVLFGMFGVHRFMVGKIGTGLIWAFSLGCYGVGQLVDIIYLLMGKFTDTNGHTIELPASLQASLILRIVVSIAAWFPLLALCVFAIYSIATNEVVIS
jgi:TM2 domain-containing membrane protein YozV